MSRSSGLTIAKLSRPRDVVVTADFLEQEIWRAGASLPELRTAIDFVGEQARFDQRAYEALSPRMRRLVDLVTVAGHSLAQKLCSSPQLSSAA